MTYRDNLEKNYSLRSNNFWTGFFAVFGGGTSTYRRAIRIIREIDERRAMSRDVENLKGDSFKVVQERNLPLKKQLADACQ